MNNPLIDGYKKFKLRKIIGEELAVNVDGTVDLAKLDLIKQVNKNSLVNEIHPTTLCNAEKIVKELIIDSYEFGPIGSGVR